MSGASTSRPVNTAASWALICAPATASLTAFSDKGFFIPNSVSYVEFERDAEGAVTQVTLHGAGEPVAHARIGALAQ